MGGNNTSESLRAEIEDLRQRLAEYEQTLHAIRSGEVDAVLVSGSNGPRVYTLTGAESPYRFLIEQMNEGALSFSSAGLILYCNQRFAELVRTPLENVIGRQLPEFIDDSSRESYDALIRQIPSDGRKAEIRLRASDRTPVPVHLSVSLYDSGDQQGVCATVTDLTAQKQTDELIASGRLARLILEQTTQAIAVTDSTGKIVQANKAAHDLAGTNVLWRKFEDAFPLLSEDPSEAEGNLSALPYTNAICNGEPVANLEARLRHGGMEFHVIVGVAPLTRADGQAAGCVVTFTDVTERKRAEAVLTQSNEQLRRANSDLEQFAYSASHDLRQPIRGIAIYSQLLEKTCRSSLDDQSLEYLHFVRGGALQLEKLVSDFLEYTQLSAQDASPAGEVDSNHALQAVRETLAGMIEEQGALITADPLPTVRMAETHLQQLFQNLLANAIKYRSLMPPVIHISAQKAHGADVFCVRDNGIGIAPEYHKQIFGVFKRLHGNAHEGTGIGLAICQRIVERYNGRIWVESELGQGAAFFFTIP